MDMNEQTAKFDEQVLEQDKELETKYIKLKKAAIRARAFLRSEIPATEHASLVIELTEAIGLAVVLGLFLLSVSACSNKPAPLPTAAIAPAVPSCPDGFTAVSSHDATRGANAGHGFILVRYNLNGKEKHLFCTASTVIRDPRRNQPVSAVIPQPGGVN